MSNYHIIPINDPKDNIRVQKRKVELSLKEIIDVINTCKEESIKAVPDFNIVASGWLHLLQRLPMPIELYDNTFILRARSNENKIFKTADEISYNKSNPSLCKAGRFNLDGEAVFYGTVPLSTKSSNGQFTSILECCKYLVDENNSDPFQYLTIGKWVVQKKIRMIMLTFFQDAFDKCDSVKFINPVYTDFLSKMYSSEDKEKVLYFYRCISEAAGTKSEAASDYIYSTAFYHALRYFYGPEIGIIYSSSGTGNSGLNIVLSKEILEGSYLKLSDVVMFKCERSPYKRTEMTLYPCSKLVQPDRNGRFTLNILY